MEEIEMLILEKYNHVFMECFGVDEEVLTTLEYQSIPAWDSVGHMDLVAELEDVFDIAFETDDIIEFSSYEKGKEILKKYDIEI
jgi:acyl carrier protein